MQNQMANMLEERKSQSVSSSTKNNVGRQSSQKRKVNLKEAPRLFGGGRRGSFMSSQIVAMIHSIPRIPLVLLQVCSWRAEGDADPLSYPAGRKQLLGEGTVEGVQPGLPVSVVGKRTRLVVQQHADAAVMGVAGDGLPTAIVPGAKLVLVQLQAPGQFIHSHHASLALLLPGDALVGYLERRIRRTRETLACCGHLCGNNESLYNTLGKSVETFSTD